MLKNTHDVKKHSCHIRAQYLRIKIFEFVLFSRFIFSGSPADDSYASISPCITPTSHYNYPVSITTRVLGDMS